MAEINGGVSNEISNKERLRSALVTALFQSDPHKTFRLETTPDEITLFDACLSPDLDYLKSLLSNLRFYKLALTERLRPYGSISLPIYNLRLMNIIAAKSGYADIVGYLLSLAAREKIMEAHFIDRDTMHATLSSQNVEVLQMLIYIDPSCVNLDLGHGGYPLNQAINQYQRAPENTIKTVKLLLESGADPNAIFGSFLIPGGNITNAARSGHVEVVRLLIKHGASVVDSGAIQAAVSNGQVDILDLLVDHGADVNERSRTCLKIAGQRKREEEAEQAGETPLHIGVRMDQLLAAMWLIEHGADVGLKDSKGRTPLDCAIDMGRKELVEILRPHSVGQLKES